MFAKVSERVMHRVRWVLICSWIVLIISLFFDPISAAWTDPQTGIMGDTQGDGIVGHAICVLFQGQCLPQLEVYPVGARIFWGMVIPLAIFIVMALGHETWRRICPLYFFSQIPRALGLDPRRSLTEDHWLVRNHLYFQFGLFFMGLTLRHLGINTYRPLLGLFLILTLGTASTVVFLYGGRSWCHYVCPFGMVQMVFTGPGGLLDSQAHKAPARSITQSMCRTMDDRGQAQSACVSCKSACLDIDSEKSYWQSLRQPGRKLVQYGYLGIVIGYFVYYWISAGNLNYYFSGAWSHEVFEWKSLISPGFYWNGQAIALPKWIAAPLTMATFVALSYWICDQAERYYRRVLNQRQGMIASDAIAELSTHRIFSLCSFLAFNLFFVYGGRPELLRFPLWIQFLGQTMVILVSSLWLAKVWQRSSDRYMREGLADNLRRQLKKLPVNVSLLLEGRSVDQLNSDEVYILAKTLPNMTGRDRRTIYQAVLLEALQAEHVTSVTSLIVLEKVRQVLGITENQHYEALGELSQNHQTFHLIYPESPKTLNRERRQGSNLSRADLSRADLSRSDLSRSDLSRSDLSRSEDALTRLRQDNDSN
jgi:Pentapeptide repeats (8 copies)/4Fe-4S binding domain